MRSLNLGLGPSARVATYFKARYTGPLPRGHSEPVPPPQFLLLPNVVVTRNICFEHITGTKISAL